MGRMQFQYWSPDEYLARQLLIDPYLGPAGQVGDNRNEPRPSREMFWFDDRGRMLFEQRGMVSYERSRFNWEGGYWQQEDLYATLDVKTYGETLLEIEKWAVGHPQFSQMGVMNQQKEEIYPIVGCYKFVRDILKQVSGEDILNRSLPIIRAEWIIVEPIELGADPRRLEEMMKADPELHLAFANDLGYSWGGADGTQKHDPKALFVLPASYHADGSVWERDEYAGKIHIMRPTGDWYKEVGLGAKNRTIRNTYICNAILLGIVASICSCCFACFRNKSV